MKCASLLELIKSAEGTGAKECIIAAVGDRILFFESILLSGAEQPLLVAERDGIVQALAFHDGRVYDAGKYGIYDTVKGEQVVGRRGVTSLFSHNGVLFDAGSSGLYETFAGREIGNLNYFWRGLAVHDNKFYYGLELGVRNTINLQDTCCDFGSFRERAPHPVFALAIHKGVLYDGGMYGVYETLSDRKVAERKAPVNALFVHNGKLYDAGWYGIKNTLNDEDALLAYVSFFDTPSALVSIPLNSWLEANLGGAAK